MLNNGEFIYLLELGGVTANKVITKEEINIFARKLF